ncbi:DNA invertase Pin-like site-specific DNA recombinase [Paenibacillus cellulosilyticus]|uniref:DNA invertase Pin-like site-specific DNA recombinase n=1 Tax=Paenibacillus cellulosilyticus TaxID=375489 RepID=A0A2V2YSM7_9BACL|nr:recombinase family protein [Paenibacillus cellulosilyticus]PWW01169.1 DNA invertase Pin-like site-specific DNA recombinase [Paenibacillus cellulosilyticus]QKS46870.1 recombinase family protein [Paenibacillus cellulosilyticus]
MYGKLPVGKYCAYLRKSRADLEAEGRGEEDTYAKHERILFDLARRLEITITEIYREKAGTSGERISERPEMIRLLSDVEDGVWNGVLAVEVERLARGDTMDQGIVAQAFKYSKTLIVTPMRTYDPLDPNDEEYFEFNLFMARREFKTITRRLQDGRVGSVKEGKYVGNVAPYGYKRVKLPGKGWSLEIHPDQSPIVQLIFSLYTDPDPDRRMGTSRIANYLNEDIKAPTLRNVRWTVATVNGIIRNPVYMGKVKWKSRPLVKSRHGKSRPRMELDKIILEDGLHDSIIDEVTWKRAQEIMASNSHPPAPKGKISNPLAGLVRCGICGGAVVLRPYVNNPDALMCSTARCKNISSYLYLVEEKLLLALRQWLDAYKAHMETETTQTSKTIDIRVNALQEAAKGLQRKLKELREQLSNLDDLLEQKVYTVEKYVSRSSALTDRIQEAEAALMQVQSEIELEVKRSQAKAQTIPQLEHVLEVYPTIQEPAQKNELMKSILENVIYTKEKGGRWSGAQDQFTLQLQPRIPK